MSNDNDKSNAEAIIGAIKELHRADVMTLARGNDERVYALAVPSGMSLQSVKPLLDEYLSRPERVRGVARLTDLDSFLAHVARFRDESTVIFADVTPKKPGLLAVYDYHQNGVPAFCAHRAAFTFPLSEAWQKWSDRDGQTMTQAGFASWLEDHAHEVVDPDGFTATAKKLTDLELTPAKPAEVLKVSRGLTVRSETTVSEAVNLANGAVKFLYDEQVKGEKGEKIEVPTGFIVAVPVFENGDAYPMAVRLRYRVSKGEVSWSFAMLNADDVIRHAIKEAVEKVRATGVPLFIGSPEQ